MLYLLIPSLIWAFSFGLIKKYLGGLDASFVAFIRLALSFLLFLPLLKPRKISLPLTVRLVLLGAVQFGLMYVFYIQAFRFLAAHQVALFTIFTPLYVTLIADLFRKRFQFFHFWTALLAVAGTAVIVYSGLQKANLLTGFVLVQASNICFAFGQVYYQRLVPCGAGLKNREHFACLYLGGAFLAAISMLLFSNPKNISLNGSQWFVLLYLGILASGIGFFLWNIGATRVNTGMLAVLNNAKIPLAVLVSLLFFGEHADWLRLVGGGGVMTLALWLNYRRSASNSNLQT